jgi:hypothetical protein
MRDAVAHGVEIHERIIGDAPAHPLLAPRQRPHRQRSEGHPLLALEPRAGRFMRRPVDPLVGERHPRGQMRLSAANDGNVSPATALRFKDLTPDSVLPLVRARYGAQARGCTAQSRQKPRYAG